MLSLALPAAGLAGSKLSCAANFLNVPSTGTFICFEVAVTVLFDVSTCACAAPRNSEATVVAARIQRSKGVFISALSVRLLEKRDHACQQTVTVDEVMLQRRQHVNGHQCEQGVVQPDVDDSQHGLQRGVRSD